MEYLFLDIEWVQKEGTSGAENCQPVQIGIIGTDKALEQKRLYSQNISLENTDTLTEETCKLTHITRKSVRRSQPENVVFEKVGNLFSSYKYIVVWTIRTYEIFIGAMARAGINVPRHRVLIMQDMVSTMALEPGQTIGFESSLIKAGITYEKKCLHYSKHDVAYLYELFKNLQSQYARLSGQEYYVVNRKSKIMHSAECRYGKTSNSENIINGKMLLFSGYRPCKYCERRGELRKIQWVIERKKKKRLPSAADMRNLPLTESNIQMICGVFGIKCSYIANVVFLTTSIGYWRVYLDNDKVTAVYHGNYREKRSDFFKKKKNNEGFHKQNVTKKNFYDVVQYIYYHDKNQYKNPGKKSRMERLFDQIEQEQIMKRIDNNYKS